MEAYVQNSGTFVGKGGYEIFFQSWTAQEPRGYLMIAHGLAEHSGRYGNIVEALAGSGISIYCLDHRGHGKSAGKRGHVEESFMEYVHDMKVLHDFIKIDAGEKPVFLLGHSMGGVISILYALTYPEDLAGLALSSPGLIPAMTIPAWKERFAPLLVKLLPNISIKTGLPADKISRDSLVVDAYENDPAVFQTVTARWYDAFKKAIKECFSRLPEITMPVLLFHGTDDQIASCRGSELVFAGISSPDKSIHLLEGLYHESMNETKKERDQVLGVVRQWLLERLRSAKKRAAGKPGAAKKPKGAAKPRGKKTAKKR